MVRVLAAPVVWLLAVLLFAVQRLSSVLADFLDGYDRAANALGAAVLRGARRMVDLLGPFGRALRALAVPVWRRVRACWRWLNVRILLRMFRPLRRVGRWVVRHVAPCSRGWSTVCVGCGPAWTRWLLASPAASRPSSRWPLA